MNEIFQTRIAAIKAECEEIIRLSEKATQGDWHVEKGRDHVWIGNKSSGSINLWEIVHDKDIEDFKDEAIEQAVNNARFIATSRNVSPAMARVVLIALDALEKSAHYWIDNKTALESIADQWEGKL